VILAFVWLIIALAHHANPYRHLDAYWDNQARMCLIVAAGFAMDYGPLYAGGFAGYAGLAAWHAWKGVRWPVERQR
jgi:hypothetical protein